jgi:hypothetical protein
MQFVLALGNRPKGERTLYAITLWYAVSLIFLNLYKLTVIYRVYAFLAMYLLVASLALTVKAFLNIPDQLKNKTTMEIVATFFTPPVGSLVAAMVSTFGIYFFASFLYVSRLYSLLVAILIDVRNQARSVAHVQLLPAISCACTEFHEHFERLCIL